MINHDTPLIIWVTQLLDKPILRVVHSSTDAWGGDLATRQTISRFIDETGPQERMLGGLYNRIFQPQGEVLHQTSQSSNWEGESLRNNIMGKNKDIIEYHRIS